MIAPNSQPPENPLAGYEADRQRFDQQFQQQVDQTYARSPAGFIPSPSASMTRPGSQPPDWQPQNGAGAPVGPGGIPWYGQAADSPTRAPATTLQQYRPYAAPEVRPAESAYAPSGTPATSPPYYGSPPQATAAPAYTTQPTFNRMP
jgi:hypothetical protein